MQNEEQTTQAQQRRRVARFRAWLIERLGIPPEDLGNPYIATTHSLLMKAKKEGLV